MQHYVDVCAERNISCVFEVLHAFELLETKPSARGDGDHGAYDLEQHAPSDAVTLDLSPALSPLALYERSGSRPPTARPPAARDDASTRLQLDAADVSSIAEALRRCNDDAGLVCHRYLANILISGSDDTALSPPVHLMSLLTEWRKHLSLRHREGRGSTTSRGTTPSAAVFGLRACTATSLDVLLSLIADAVMSPQSIDIGHALLGGQRRSQSPFATGAFLNEATLPTLTSGWGLDMACNDREQATPTSVASMHGGIGHHGGGSKHGAPPSAAAGGASGRAATAFQRLQEMWQGRSLEHLSLAYCNLNLLPIMGERAATSFLADACFHLKTLSLRGNPTPLGAVASDGGAPWLQRLQLRCLEMQTLSSTAWRLQRLDVSCMGLGDDSASVLADMIKRHQQLKVLVARRNFFTQAGFAAFAEALVLPACAVEELYLGLQSPPPHAAAPPVGAASAQSDNGGSIFSVHGAAPSLYGVKKPRLNCAQPPTAAAASEGARGGPVLDGSYHAAATTILVALGGNTSVRVCDLTGLPLDEPNALAQPDHASSLPFPGAPFIILSALSDLMLHTSTLGVLMLTFPASLQTPMRRELRRNSAALPGSVSASGAVSHIAGGGAAASTRHVPGPQSNAALSSPSKALFAARGGPLDQFVQPPMRFTSLPAAHSGAACASPPPSAAAPTTSNLTPQLHRYAGPLHSASSLGSSNGSFHLSSGMEFEEFLVAVNTQRELKSMYPVAVRNGCPGEMTGLEVLVQHPQDPAVFAAMHVVTSVRPHQSHSTASVEAHAGGDTHPVAVPVGRRPSPQAATTAPPLRYRSADTRRRPSPPLDTPAVPHVVPPVPRNGPPTRRNSAATPRGTSSRTYGGTASSRAAVASPPNAGTLLLMLELSVRHAYASATLISDALLEAKVRWFTASCVASQEACLAASVDQLHRKWASVRDREVVVRQEMQRAMDDRQALDAQQRQMQQASEAEGDRIRALEAEVADLRLQVTQTSARGSPQPGGGAVDPSTSSQGGGGADDDDVVFIAEDNNDDAPSAADDTARTSPGLPVHSTSSHRESSAGRAAQSTNRSHAESPMEVPLPFLHVASPHPLGHRAQSQPHAPRSGGVEDAVVLMDGGEAVSRMTFDDVCRAFPRFQMAMRALSADERRVAEEMWLTSAGSETDVGADTIQPSRLRFVAFIAQCQEQRLFERSSPEARSRTSSTSTGAADGGTHQHHAEARASSGLGAHLLPPPSQDAALDASPIARHHDASPPLQRGGCEPFTASVDPAQRRGTNASSPGGNVSPLPVLRFGSVRSAGNSRSPFYGRDESTSVATMAAPAATPRPSSGHSPMYQTPKRKQVPPKPTRQSAGAGAGASGASGASPPPRINTLSLRRRTEIIRRCDQELVAAQDRHELRNKEPHITTGPTTTTTSANGHHHGRKRQTSIGRASSSGGAVVLGSKSPLIGPHPHRSMARAVDPADPADDCPTESVQFDLEDDRSSVDFEEAGDYAIAPDDGTHGGRGGGGTLLRREETLDRMDGTTYRDQSIKFDVEGTADSSPPGDPRLVSPLLGSSGPQGGHGGGAKANVRRRHERRGPDFGDSVGSSVDFDEESTSRLGSPFPTDTAPQVPTDDLFQSAKRPSAPADRSSCSTPDDSILKSPAAARVTAQVDASSLLDANRIERERDFIRTKVLPLAVWDLRQRYPQVSHVLNGMTPQEYGAFIDAWSTRDHSGQHGRVSELEELMLNCALCGMFRAA